MLFAAAVVLTVSVLQLTGHTGVLAGWERLVTALWGAASCAAAATTWWVVRRREVSATTLEGVLAVLSVLPGSNALLEAAITRQLAPTVVLALSVVAVGAVVSRGRLAAGSVAVVVALWVVVVLTRRLGPADAVTDHLLGLGLACALAYVAFDTRRRTRRRYERMAHELDERVEQLTAAWEVAAGSDRRFRGVFEASPVAIGLADEHGHFVEVNAALCRLLDRRADELLGRSSAWLTHPDDADGHGRAGALIDGAAHGVARVEKRYVRRDGSTVWALLTMSHVPGPEGQRWTLAHYLDVTERRRVASELEASRDELEAIAAVAQCGQSGSDPRPVVVAQALRLTGARTVALAERVGRNLVGTACAGADATTAQEVLGSTPFTALAYDRGGRVLVPDLAADPRANPSPATLAGIRAVLCEPVRTGGDVVAVLVVCWDRPLDGRGDAESRTVAALAAEAGAALNAERMRGQLEEQARTDPLTGLLNRRGWLRAVAAAAADAYRRGDAVTLVIADLDRFKAYNDQYGHQRGDALLQAFAAGCRAQLSEADVIGRWGGEEFVFAMPGREPDEVADVLSLIRAGMPAGQTASFGVQVWDGRTDLEQALRDADRALYEAKQNGRDQVVVAEPR